MISFQAMPKDPETAIVIYLRLKSKDLYYLTCSCVWVLQWKEVWEAIPNRVGNISSLQSRWKAIQIEWENICQTRLRARILYHLKGAPGRYRLRPTDSSRVILSTNHLVNSLWLLGHLTLSRTFRKAARFQRLKETISPNWSIQVSLLNWISETCLCRIKSLPGIKHGAIMTFKLSMRWSVN
jgi:hypothetical protein